MSQFLLLLLQFAFHALKYLLQFLAALALGIAGALFYALPWLLRLTAILVWLAAAWLGFQTIQFIYSPFSQFIPILSLQAAVALAMTAWVIASVISKVSIWSALFVSGLAVALASLGALWLFQHWELAALFFATLPVSLLMMGMLHLTLRGRRLRDHLPARHFS